MLGKIILSLILAVLLVPATARAASFDCGKARTPFAKAICTHPDLSKADDTLAAAFKGVLSGLSAPAKAEVSSAQDAWVKYANIACTKDARLPKKPYDADGITCLKGLFTDRTGQLANSKTIGGLRFYYIDLYAALKDPQPPDFGGTVGLKQISTPRIDGTDAEAVAFNHFIETGTSNDLNPALVTGLKPDDGSEDDTGSMLVTTVNPVRITMTVDFSSYGHGAAHPNYATTFVHFLRGENRRLLASDIFAGEGWQAKFQAIALAALTKQEGEDLMLDDPKSINDLVIDPARWDFSKDGLILQFEPYEVAAYAVGAPTVTIPWTDLTALLGPKAKDFQQ